MNDIYGLLYGAAGGGVVGLIVALIGGFVLHNVKRSWRELDALRERRLAALESKLDKHLEGDNAKAQEVQFKHLEGLINKLDDKFELHIEKMNKQEVEVKSSIASLNKSVENTNDYMRNLHTSIKELRKDC